MPARLASFRTRILGAILAAIIVTDLLAVWFVNDRVLAGARREADSQARLHSAEVRALYNERARTLTAEGEAVSFYPAVIAALEAGTVGPLLDWSSTLATLQGTSVTVVDATGTVVARGHAPAGAATSSRHISRGCGSHWPASRRAAPSMETSWGWRCAATHPSFAGPPWWARL
jgi:hypothetical protein